MFTFLELKQKVAQLAERVTYDVDGVATYDTVFLNQAGAWLQLAHSLLAEIYDYWIELKGIHNFTTIDGQEDYPLPNRFDKPLKLYDLTNKKKITPQTEEEYFDGNIANIADAEEGTPDIYRLYGVKGTRVAISSSGDTVKAKSSTTESSAITLRIHGYIDSAKLIEDSETIIVEGTSFATATVPKTFYEITQWAKSANSTGYITLANSSGTTLDTLAPVERLARHIILKLGKIPDDAYSDRLLFKKTILQMVNDNDYPFIDADRYFIFDAYGYSLKQSKNEQGSSFAWQKAQEALTALLNNQMTKLWPEYQHKIINTWAQAHRG